MTFGPPTKEWTPEQQAAARARNESLNRSLTESSGFGEGGANRLALTRNLGTDQTIRKPDGTSILDTAAQSTLNLGTVKNITNLTESKATDFLNNGTSSTITDTKTTASSSIKNLPNLIENPLEQFASYSVLWTMACLTPEQFNNPSSYRSTPQALQNIIFSSGGRFNDQRVRTFFGTPEYYVNNFQMNCIIGSNEKTGNSNAIKFSFDIVEPISMGLLLQSMQNAAIKAGYLHYLNNTPYVLRMDIQGYNDVGQVIKSIQPKFFTLKLVSMKFSVNESGSNYKVEAIPYNHQGFSDAINITYNDLKISGDITGKGIVAEVLATSKDSLVAVLNRNEEKLVQEGKIGVSDAYAIQFPKLSNEWYSSKGDPAQLTKATVNPLSEQDQRISGGAAGAQPDENLPINELGEASLGFDQVRGGLTLFKRAGDQYDQKTGLVKRDGMTIDPKARAFQFGQGQTLTSMINQVILSSDYAKKAIIGKPEGFGLTPEGYIKWFKLDVQIELLTLDPKIGDYAKKITYRVVPYYIHQSIFSNPNAAPVGYSELMKKICKEYQYIYTGQNVDVLKFDININNLFYTGVNPAPENEGAKTANQDQKLAEQRNRTSATGQGPAAQAQGAQLGRARPTRDPRLLAGYKGGNPDKSTEQNIAENFQQAFLSGNSADMITVDLEIMGDPYWLVDSGIGNYFAETPDPTSQVTNDGTMNYESGNVYIYLTFKTPADVNETTGLYDFSISGKESPFGGIYRVVMCENYFSDGQWKQKLKCLRMPGPQGPEVNKLIEGNTSLPISQTDNNATEIGPQESPRQSPTEDTKQTTEIANSTASPTLASNKSPTRAASSAKTFTASNSATRRVGFRYYRDLGQN